METDKTKSTPQRKLADYLAQQAERFSPRTKKMMLVLLGILTTVLSVWLVIEPFRRVYPVNATIMQDQISIQPFVRAFPDEVFSEEDYIMLKKFKNMLDSLRRYDPKIYREVLHGREGLLDSINYLIDLYHP